MNNIIAYSKAITTLSLQEKVGQLFMPAAFINDTEEEILQIEKLISEYAIGGLCFFHSRASAATNFEGQKKIVYNENSFETLNKLIQRYQKAAKYPLLMSIDAEWGLAMRIENTPQYPYAITLGAIQNNENLLFKLGKQIAADCKAAGIHWNLAPVVDINNNPNNPVIGYRSFGENKYLVTLKAAAFIKGTEMEGVLTCIKHFPGHGDTAVDSHLGLPLIEKSKEELLKNELFPFQHLINEGVDSIMAGHLSIPALADGDAIPSSLSKKMLKNLLRDEMNFKGVVISDALNMHAISKNYTTKGELEWLAFDAGNDVLCFSEYAQEGIEAILKNASEKQIEESFKRIWHLKEKAITKGATSITLSDASDLNTAIAKESLTIYKGSVADFKKQHFIGLTIGSTKNSAFFDAIGKELSFEKVSDLEQSEANLSKFDNVLIAIYPPKAKPANLFDIPQEQLDLINTLSATKNVVIYLFGNPYVLNHLKTESTKAVVIAYQNFEVFQENAALHFLGHNPAPGKTPVTIKR
ncbi:glycoside hydrolase family 3 protein [Cellulophaga sp. E16_2]|uniref:glycoside hydrolase family 3 protein n=1 Tax=unclassified Cellulophaga TaxID=2634405 RepID=UPI0013FE1CDB|nr:MULTISPECIES: glycoside hydrolase family 3 protein [unclassified Cellulophaga]MBO0592446.1 glycoside hydrolase family 3 protein [Cellulophaga sp. E16_2]